SRSGGDGVMPDAADVADSIIAETIARGVRAAAAARIDPGSAGECDNCGDAFPRLVGGLCGYCRDGRRPDYAARNALAALEVEVADSVFDKRTVTFAAKGGVLAAIEQRSEERDIGMGPAALELLEQAIAAPAT